jgi:D-glycero-D-manno-heptose 1,7-bisphosphate phosphatase
VGVGGGRPLTPAVFFDRDGVLNESVVRAGKPHPPAGVDDLRIDEAAPVVVPQLRAAGFAIVVITNQPDVARGTTTRERIDAINDRIRATVPIDALYVCFHDTADACDCRKPKPGMILEAAREHDLDLSRSYVVGDRWSDIQAGRTAGCKTVWIDRHYEEKAPHDADANVFTLTAACNWILDDCDSSRPD